MGRRLDALNAIAVDQGYTGDEPTSVVGAINAIVDAMGGDGSAVGVANAITALAPYIGGGGGVDVGPLVTVIITYDVPTVGSDLGATDGPYTLTLGNTVIARGNITGIDGTYPMFGSFAAGMTAQTISYEGDELSAYACTISKDGEGNAVYQTIDPYTLESTRTSGESGYSWTFVIPEMNDGVALVLYPHTAAA